MLQFLIRGVTGAAIGYSLPVFVLFAFAWLGFLGINPPAETTKAWAMSLTSQPMTIVGTFAGCVVGLISAARHRNLKNTQPETGSLNETIRSPNHR